MDLMSTQTVAETEYVSLPEAASVLGVHRATVNEMVLHGRLEAIRDGAQWRIRRADLEGFAANYVRPPNAPPRRGEALPQTSTDLVRLLTDFHSASASELAPFLDVHEGNVRKHLRLMERAGLVRREPDGQWFLTPKGGDLTSHPTKD
jgi:excisionase family DNA binding protein